LGRNSLKVGFVKMNLNNISLKFEIDGSLE